MQQKLIILAYYITIIILLCSFDSVFATEKIDPAITWTVDLHFDETGGAHDLIRFGEATNALDETSPDSHDYPKPPPPIPPCVHGYFTTDFEEPYHMLLWDFRKDGDTQQIWNIMVQWIPAEFKSSTTLTLSWDIINLTKSPYNSIKLYEDDDKVVVDMLIDSSYSYESTANSFKNFQIQCKQIDTNKNLTPFPSVFYLILSLIMVLFLIYRKKQSIQY
jgi:hypothetical protein